MLKGILGTILAKYAHLNHDLLDILALFAIYLAFIKYNL